MSKQRQRFWMCFVDGANPPKHKHYSSNEAIIEAERLAKLTGQDVFLLETSEFVRYTPPVPPPIFEWRKTIT